MAFDVQAIADDIANGILVWCGVTSPTPDEVLLAEMAANSARDTIKFFRGLGADDDFETEYNSLAIEMGVYAYQKRGVDGVTSFGENGLQRSYEKGSFPASMTSRIRLKVETG